MGITTEQGTDATSTAARDLRGAAVPGPGRGVGGVRDHPRVQPLRLADVLGQVDPFLAAFGIVLIFKAVDTAIRLNVAAGVGWLAAAFYTATGRRSGPWMVLLMGAWLLLGGYPSNHLVLLLWTAAALLLFEHRRDLELALTAALSAMYLYAGAAKVWTKWLSGEIITAVWPEWLPMVGDPVVVAQAVIVAELLLGVAVWLRPVPRATAVAATVVHAGITVGMSATWEMTPSIVLFNLLPVAIWWRLSRR